MLRFDMQLHDTTKKSISPITTLLNTPKRTVDFISLVYSIVFDYIFHDVAIKINKMFMLK